jgi:hypothetical protein
MEVNDFIQKNCNLKEYKISRDIILAGTALTFLAISDTQDIVNAVILYLTLICIRFVYSILTRFSVNGQTYYQLSGHTALFTSMILVSPIQTIYKIALIVPYAFLNACVGAHLTTDIITTIFMIYCLHAFVLKQ